MTHIFSKKIQMGSCEDAYRNTSKRTFLNNVTTVHMEDNMPVRGPHIRFFNQVFTGLLSLRMLEIMFYLVISVGELVILVEGMRCL